MLSYAFIDPFIRITQVFHTRMNRGRKRWMSVKEAVNDRPVDERLQNLLGCDGIFPTQAIWQTNNRNRIVPYAMRNYDSKQASTGWKYAADTSKQTAGPAQCFEQQRVNTRVTYANCCSPTFNLTRHGKRHQNPKHDIECHRPSLTVRFHVIFHRPCHRQLGGDRCFGSILFFSLLRDPPPPRINSNERIP